MATIGRSHPTWHQQVLSQFATAVDSWVLDERRVERYVGHTVVERSARDVLSTTKAVRNKPLIIRFRTELPIAPATDGSKWLKMTLRERSRAAVMAVDASARLESG